MKFSQEKKHVNRRRTVTAMGAFVLGTTIVAGVASQVEPEAKEENVVAGQVVVLNQYEGSAYAQAVNSRELGEYSVEFEITEEMDLVLNGNVFTVMVEDGEVTKAYKTTQEEFDSMTKAEKDTMNRQIDEVMRQEGGGLQ